MKKCLKFPNSLPLAATSLSLAVNTYRGKNWREKRLYDGDWMGRVLTVNFNKYSKAENSSLENSQVYRPDNRLNGLYFVIFHSLQIILVIAPRFAMIYTTQSVVMMGNCTSTDANFWRKHVSLTMTGWLKTSLTSAWMVFTPLFIQI